MLNNNNNNNNNKNKNKNKNIIKMTLIPTESYFQLWMI